MSCRIYGLDHGVSHPGYFCTTPQHFRTVSKEHAGTPTSGCMCTRGRDGKRPMLSLPGSRMVKNDRRIQALGRHHIGGVAYGVWALPPMSGELPKGTDKKSDSS